jgi:hypothetical protein
MANNNNNNNNNENTAPTDHRLEVDCKTIDEWTRATLFPKVKFLYQDSDLAVDGEIYNFFKMTCMEKTGEGMRDGDRAIYQRGLWHQCVPRIRKALSVKRSGVTNLTGIKFMGKHKACSLQDNNVFVGLTGIAGDFVRRHALGVP